MEKNYRKGGRGPISKPLGGIDCSKDRHLTEGEMEVEHPVVPNLYGRALTNLE